MHFTSCLCLIDEADNLWRLLINESKNSPKHSLNFISDFKGITTL